MDFEEIFAGKNTSLKEATVLLSEQLLKRKLKSVALVTFAGTAKDPVKAACIEALEQASKKEPGVIDARAFDFVTEQLRAKAPRVKWESARVIGNSARLFPKKLDAAITYLLENTEHNGTVVRWSAAYALAEIVKLGKHPQLSESLRSVMAREEKNSIKKIYAQALKQLDGK